MEAHFMSFHVEVETKMERPLDPAIQVHFRSMSMAYRFCNVENLDPNHAVCQLKCHALTTFKIILGMLSSGAERCKEIWVDKFG
jgi:hypothetical protein